MSKEIKVEKNFGGVHYYERIAKNPSYLADVVNSIAKLPFENCQDTSTILGFDIENKLSYNNVITYKHIVEDYAFYSTFIDDTYQAIATTKPNCRDRVMRIINREYLKAKASLLADSFGEDIIKVIKLNSDNIIREVLAVLKEKLYESNNLDEQAHIEEIEMALEIIIGDAFINCKILENPNIN